MNAEQRAYVARRNDVLARVRRVLTEELDVRREPEEIDPDVALFGTGLGLDSVDAIEVLLSIEAEFSVAIPDEAAGRSVLRTVGTLVDLVMAHDGAGGDEK